MSYLVRVPYAARGDADGMPVVPTAWPSHRHRALSLPVICLGAVTPALKPTGAAIRSKSRLKTALSLRAAG